MISSNLKDRIERLLSPAIDVRTPFGQALVRALLREFFDELKMLPVPEELELIVDVDGKLSFRWK